MPEPSDRSLTLARREFLRFVAASPLAGLVSCRSIAVEDVTNVLQLDELARRKLDHEAYEFLASAADDGVTLRRNREAFELVQIRARRLVDVSAVDTGLTLFDEPLTSPLLLAPIGLQRLFHPDAELPVVRAAAATSHRAIISSFSSRSIEEIAAAGGPVWFQLYPTDDRDVTEKVLDRAEAAGCRVVALTVDVPVTGNRESQRGVLRRLLDTRQEQLGTLEPYRPWPGLFDAGMTWDMVSWLKQSCAMSVVLKGIVTREDATLAVEHGADGLIVSNHGGRQEESGRGTIECLPEIVEAVNGRIPVLIDGGFRRGTDVFKALALGADAVCIGRPYAFGLAAFGQAGVEAALEILQAELVRIMQLAGTPDLRGITRAHVS